MKILKIGNIATTCPISKISKLIVKISDSDNVRGIEKIDGKNYKWSTLQQYEYHGGFKL